MLHKRGLFLYSIEEIKTPWNYRFSRHFDRQDLVNSGTVHWHDYFEFEIVADGVGSHLYNDTCQRISRGSAYLLTPFDFHTVQPIDGQSPRIYNFNFNELSLPPELITRLSASARKCCFTEDEMRMVEGDIRLLEQTQKQEDSFLKNQLMQCCFQKLILLFLRKCSLEEQAQSLSTTPAFHRAVAYTQAHFRSELDLQSLAGEVGLTPNYLGQLFLKNYGISFKAYLKNMRLKHARNLLEHSGCGIAEIGRRSGFKTTSYFIQCFHDAFSLTPKQYRDRAGKKHA